METYQDISKFIPTNNLYKLQEAITKKAFSDFVQALVKLDRFRRLYFYHRNRSKVSLLGDSVTLQLGVQVVKRQTT